MVVGADAELTSARPPTIAIAFANRFVCVLYLYSQLTTIYYNIHQSGHFAFTVYF